VGPDDFFSAKVVRDDFSESKKPNHRRSYHQPSEEKQIVFLESPDLYGRSPESDDLPYKSMELKEASCCKSEG